MAVTSTTPGRRQPCCRTCGSPMAGHKRPHGSPVCPPSPPSTPPPPSLASRLGPRLDPGPISISAPIVPTAPFLTEADEHPWPARFPVPGVLHRPNPHWIDPAPHASLLGCGSQDDRASVARTEPLSGPVKREGDAHSTRHRLNLHPQSLSAGSPSRLRSCTRTQTYRHDNGEGDEEDGSEEDDEVEEAEGSRTPRQRSVSSVPSRPRSPSASVTGSSLNVFGLAPVMRMFSLSSTDLPALHRFAAQRGLHAGLLSRPRQAPPPDPYGKGKHNSAHGPLRPDKTWWAIVGHKPAVQHVIDLQEADAAGTGRMPTAPGYFDCYAPKTPKGVTMVQMVFCSTLGAAIMLLSLMLL